MTSVISRLTVGRLTIWALLMLVAAPVFSVENLLSALGGIVSDKVAIQKGLDGRTKVLFALIMLEGLFLIL